MRLNSGQALGSHKPWPALNCAAVSSDTARCLPRMARRGASGPPEKAQRRSVLLFPKRLSVRPRLPVTTRWELVASNPQQPPSVAAALRLPATILLRYHSHPAIPAATNFGTRLLPVAGEAPPAESPLPAAARPCSGATGPLTRFRRHCRCFQQVRFFQGQQLLEIVDLLLDSVALLVGLVPGLRCYLDWTGSGLAARSCNTNSSRCARRLLTMA